MSIERSVECSVCSMLCSVLNRLELIPIVLCRNYRHLLSQRPTLDEEEWLRDDMLLDILRAKCSMYVCMYRFSFHNFGSQPQGVVHVSLCHSRGIEC